MTKRASGGVSRPHLANGGSSSLVNGMAAGAEWVSAAAFVGLTGTLYVLGYDGLTFTLGWMAGFVLLALLIAPRIAGAGASSLPSFFAARFGSELPRVVAASVVLLSALPFLAIQLYGAGLIGALVAGLDMTTAIALALLAVLAAWTLGRFQVSAGARLALGIFILAAFLAPAVLYSLGKYGNPFPQIAYGEALREIAAHEKNLLAQRLADARALKAHAQPFATFDAWNFFALILCLAAGAATFPLLLKRLFIAPTTPHARATLAWALLFAFLIYVTAPAYAAFVKLELYGSLIGRPLARLPDWIFTWGGIPDPARPAQALLNICGKAAASAEAVVANCGAGHAGVLRLQDFAVDPDVVALAAPAVLDLPEPITILFAVGALIASLLTASVVLDTIADVFHADAGAPTDETAARSFVPNLGALIAVAVAAVLATIIALAKPADMITLAAWSFSLAAAGLFPALVLAISWPRASAWGCAIGMGVGLAITLYYIIGTRYVAVSFFETWGVLSSASDIATHKFATLKQAWIKAPEGPPKAAAWAALDAHARTIANWWGVRNIAAGVFGLIAGLLPIVLVSIVTRRAPVEPRSAAG